MNYSRVKTLGVILVFCLSSIQASAWAAPCDPLYFKHFQNEIALTKGQAESSAYLTRQFHDMAQDAARDKKISSGIAVISGLLMAYANMTYTRAILGKTAAATRTSKALALPIVTQIESAAQISKVFAQPLTALGLNGLNALSGLVKISLISSDKVYIISKGIVNFATKDGTIEINVNDIAQAEGAYSEAILRVEKFRETYVDQAPGRLENGLSFGAKAAEFTKNLERISSYETRLYNDLATMKQARYLIEESSCAE